MVIVIIRINVHCNFAFDLNTVGNAAKPMDYAKFRKSAQMDHERRKLVLCNLSETSSLFSLRSSPAEDRAGVVMQENVDRTR